MIPYFHVRGLRGVEVRFEGSGWGYREEADVRKAEDEGYIYTHRVKYYYGGSQTRLKNLSPKIGKINFVLDSNVINFAFE